MTNQTQADGLGYKDRSGALVAFGILQILLGGLCVLFFVFGILGAILVGALPHPAGGPPPPTARTLIPGVALYAGIGALFISTGVGALRARRWARAIMLAFSWLWLVFGVLGTVMAVAMTNSLVDSLVARTPQLDAVVPVIKGLIYAMCTFLFILLPLAFVAFYRSPHVRATCLHRDPEPSFTDRCPMPVLGVAVMLASGGFYFVTIAVSYGVVPVFGHALAGAPGVLVCLLLAATWTWLAVMLCRLRPIAWWATLGLSLVMSSSSLITFATVDVIDYYRAAGMTEAQLAMMRNLSFFSRTTMVAMIAVWVIPFLGYLLYLKRFFGGDRSDSGTGLAA